MLMLQIALNIAYVDKGAIQDRSSAEQRTAEARRVYAALRLDSFWRVVVLCDLVE
jgi:hypothetical protein